MEKGESGMGKIPCRLCGGCGLYNGAGVEICECGADLRDVPFLLVDEPIPPERYGEIDKSLPVYVQKCPVCGTENFTEDPDRRVKICCNCGKYRVASVKPVLFQKETEQTPPDRTEEEPAEGLDAFEEPPEGPSSPLGKKEPEEEDGAVLRWLRVLEGVRKSVEGSLEAGERPDEGGSEASSDEGGADAASGWEALLGKKASPPPGEREPSLTLTALRYGKMSLTLAAGQRGLPYVLGRSAGCGKFLSKDLRVSNEHCSLSFERGRWTVTDCRSTNGTAVNRQFLESGGNRTLQDGDELTLGHHPDSMAFRVTIR